MYISVTVLTFLEEVNENIRYVRHQMRTFRGAIRGMSKRVSQYQNPAETFDLYDALSTLEDECENPD